MKTKFTKLLIFVLIIILTMLALGTCQGPVAEAAPFADAPTNPGLTNLAACWDLEETSGTRYDYTANDNDLADVNTVLYGTGISGNSGDFEGDNNEYLTIADNANLSIGDNDMTITGWIYFESQTQDQYFINKYSVTGNKREYFLSYQLSSDKFYIAASSDGITPAVVTGTNYGNVPTVTWLFFVAQYDKTADLLKLSINDGTFNTAALAGGIYDSDFAFTLSRNTASIDLDGMMDTVNIYKRLLTADELTWLYNSGAGRACADLNPPTPTPTFTNTFTSTATSTATNTATNTATDTPTITLTPSDTPTDTPTFTSTFTASHTPTDTGTSTFTNTFTFTPTETFTRTNTFTRTSTNTRTPTNTLNPTQISATEQWFATRDAALPGYRTIAEENSPLVAIIAALCGIIVLAGMIWLAIFFTSRRKK